MSELTEAFARNVVEYPDKVAFFNSDGEAVTYAEADRQSDALGRRFMLTDPSGKPVVLYGHKSPLMIVGILACMKSGRAYAPVDSATPEARLTGILDQLGGAIVVNISDAALGEARKHAIETIDPGELASLVATSAEPLGPSDAISGDDIMYVMFTSGSTGKPKGVMMHAGAIDRFTENFIALLHAKPEDVFFDRAPLSFDLSIFDLVTSLAIGGTLFSLEAAAESSLKASFEALGAAHISQWVSTPSFLEMCLTDQSFNRELLPDLRVVSLCGEVLRNVTASRLLDEFPDVLLINAYGATETQSACDIPITREIIEKYNPLPVGYMDPGMRAYIHDPETFERMPVGEEGEIVLAGCTVSKGYLGRPDLTEAAFGEFETEDGEVLPYYKTGDVGYINEEGLLFCLGRYDFQVKVNGYRIEIGDIEENLCAMDEVSQACVVPVEHDGLITHVCAYVQLADPNADRSFKKTRELKQKLKEAVPPYMVPRTFRYLDDFPTNANGKIDRKALTNASSE